MGADAVETEGASVAQACSTLDADLTSLFSGYELDNNTAKEKFKSLKNEMSRAIKAVSKKKP